MQLLTGSVLISEKGTERIASHQQAVKYNFKYRSQTDKIYIDRCFGMDLKYIHLFGPDSFLKS